MSFRLRDPMAYGAACNAVYAATRHLSEQDAEEVLRDCHTVMEILAGTNKVLISARNLVDNAADVS